ncbi:MAG: cyclic lactone autoinducer peptide [Oscillospiraceae bacterium]|jgi:cyclic lactone autoinducer peptide|nr:cyclic lactone autoinducer peptide [Oscillospiraceae bacterium]
MKNAKEIILNVIAKMGLETAVNSAGSASSWHYHQAKEPKNLEARLKELKKD